MDTNEERIKYHVERPIYSYKKLTEQYHEVRTEFSLLKSIKSKSKCPKPSMKSIVKNIIPFPFIMASFYSYKLLLSDLIAGFTMLIFHIPQGMAYGLLAGLQPINGLYASFIPPLVYFLFGTSRHISIGTFSIMAILSSAIVMRESTSQMPNLYRNQNFNHSASEMIFNKTDFENEKLNIAIATTILAGGFQLIMGLCRFGFFMNYISDSLVGGFTTAAAFHVMISQFGKILGYSIDRYSGIGELPYKLYMFGMRITEIHWVTLSISMICIVILFLFSQFINPVFQKKFKLPLPIQFVLVILATAISYYGNINTNLSVKIIGPIPKGLPSLLIPDIKIMHRVIFDAFILAIVGCVMNSALVKLYSLKFSYEVNYNQELVAYGLANICGSFFQCTISAGALARSSAVVQAGMKSQVSSIISCALMLFVLLFIGPLFESVPKCVLSAIIIVSLKGMLMQFTNLPHLYRTSKYDFQVWIVTFLATVLFNVPLGLTTGFLFSLLTIVIRLQNPQVEILGRLANTNIYKNVKHYDDAKEIRNVKIFRFEAPLYFANAELFKTKLFKKISMKSHIKLSDNKPINSSGSENVNDESLKNEICENEETKLNIDFVERLKFLVIDFSCINYVDNVAIRVLNNIYNTLQQNEISLFIAAPNNKVRELLEISKFAEDKLNEIMFVTVHDAVLRCLEKCISSN